MRLSGIPLIGWAYWSRWQSSLRLLATPGRRRSASRSCFSSNKHALLSAKLGKTGSCLRHDTRDGAPNIGMLQTTCSDVTEWTNRVRTSNKQRPGSMSAMLYIGDGGSEHNIEAGGFIEFRTEHVQRQICAHCRIEQLLKSLRITTPSGLSQDPGHEW